MSEEIKKIIAEKKSAALKEFEEEISKLTQDWIEGIKKLKDLYSLEIILGFSCSDAIKF